MKRVVILGCGQLGSRHLQALKSVDQDLDITVYDPLSESLNIASDRYRQFVGKDHKVAFITEMCHGEHFDLVIVATSSDVRADVIENLLSSNDVQYMVLEKLLFNKKYQYEKIETLLESKGVKAWVNCSMRIMPFYKDVEKALSGSNPVHYRVTGAGYGLVTNAIHYIDHMAHLNKCLDFFIDTEAIERRFYESKRKGFKELNGTITIRFGNGGTGSILCLPEGTMPVCIEISGKDYRCISKESEGRAWVSKFSNDWVWEEVIAPLPYQSQMTAWIASELFESGQCGLASYNDSSRIHQTFLDALARFLKEASLFSSDFYPFT